MHSSWTITSTGNIYYHIFTISLPAQYIYINIYYHIYTQYFVNYIRKKKLPRCRQRRIRNGQIPIGWWIQDSVTGMLPSFLLHEAKVRATCCCAVEWFLKIFKEGQTVKPKIVGWCFEFLLLKEYLIWGFLMGIEAANVSIGFQSCGGRNCWPESRR